MRVRVCARVTDGGWGKHNIILALAESARKSIGFRAGQSARARAQISDKGQ